MKYDDIKSLAKNNPCIRSIGKVGVDGNTNTWGMLWCDVVVDDQLGEEQKRQQSISIVQQTFPNASVVVARVSEEEKGYPYKSPKGKDVVSVIFNIDGHPIYDARIHKDLNS